MTDVIIRPTTEDDWESIRALRLEMIRDTPSAYAESLDDALRHDEQEWRSRGRRGLSATGTSLVAIDSGDHWVGTMSGWVPTPAVGPLLVGVYVAPSHRGHAAGVADRLLDAIEDWARGHGSVLRLEVHESNQRARAFYTRRGYGSTGKTQPYALNPLEREIEMVHALTAPAL